MRVDTRGLSRAAVFAALYNAARGVICSGFFPETITEETASRVLAEMHGQKYAFSLHGGKWLLFDLTDQNSFDASQYDLEHGGWMANFVLEVLYETHDPCHPMIVSMQSLRKVSNSLLTKAAQEALGRASNMIKELQY